MLVLSYSLFLLYLMLIVTYAVIGIGLVTAGVLVFVKENPHAVTSLRPVTVVIITVGVIVLYSVYLISTLILPTMWNSLPTV